MQYEVMIDVFSKIAMAIGICVICLIIIYVIDALKNKIEKIMKRQCKIRCLCKHEYVEEWYFPSERDLMEYRFICRKCGKVLMLNVVEDEGGASNER